MEASLAGNPIAVKTKRVFTAPVDGIPAAPMLATAEVILQIKHRFLSNIKVYHAFLKSLSLKGSILYTFNQYQN